MTRKAHLAIPANADLLDRKSRLQHLTDLVIDTATRKGWTAYVASQDNQDYRYASVAVKRTPPNTYATVSATFEVTSHDGAKISYEKTSFDRYGLADLYDAISNEFWKIPWIRKKTVSRKDDDKPMADLALLERLLRRFHFSVRQLGRRHADRTTLAIEDEYDVQHLLHVMLRGLFDDVRPEEYSPSYAGGASRMDFLLKSEQVVIETKMASNVLRDRQVGEQLMVDIQRYRAHPDCKRLICFVYDPHGHIRTPGGLETDLGRLHDNLEVRVIVVST